MVIVMYTSRKPPPFVAWRKRKGWTQKQAADRLSVGLRTLKHWEAGTRKPREDMRRLIDRISEGAVPPTSWFQHEAMRAAAATKAEARDQVA